MDVKSVAEEKKLAYNVIALHVDVSASNPTSIIVTGNTANADEELLNMSNSTAIKRPLVSSIGGRARSASAGRDKKSDLRARYWASLFENLQHAIYKLYQTCETDESINECEEVILVLENYTREFHDLAKWFRMKCEYENTPPSQRPTSLAWGVSKSSPGKMFRKGCPPKSDSACRELTFELDPSAANNNNLQTSAVLPLNMRLNLSNMNPIGEPIIENGITDLPVHNDNLLQPVDLKTKSTRPQSIDCSCQTEDEILAVKKTLPASRKTIASSPSYTKKFTRNLSISTAPEKTTALSTKRVSGSVSPRKPVPGRNIAAPVFVPGRKLCSLSKSSENKATSETPSKMRIARSHSDSVFETTNHSLKNQSNEKPYASVECVKSISKDDVGPKSPSVNSMQVIVEHVVTEPVREIRLETIKFNEQEIGRPSSTKSNPTEAQEAITNQIEKIKNLNSSDTIVAVPPTTTSQVVQVVESKSGDVCSTKIVSSLTTDVPNAPLLPAEKTEIPDTSVTANVPPSTQPDSAPLIPVSKSEPDIPSTNELNTITPPSVKKTETSNVSSASVPTLRRIETASISEVRHNEGNTAPLTSVKKTNLMTEKKSSPDMSKKTEIRRAPFKNNTTARVSTRQWDPKSSQTSATNRKGNLASSPSTARITNQNYVKNVGVPKTFNDGKNERRTCTERNLQTPNARVAKTNNIPPSYVTAIKANSKEFHHAKDSARYSNMIRSKTSIDMKWKPHDSAKNLVPVKMSSEERDLLPRSRRSSKDTDGWETVISRSRRSFPNSLNMKDKLKVLDVTKSFCEPGPSTSLPTITIPSGKEKSSECAKLEKNKNRNRNNSHAGGNNNAHNHKNNNNNNINTNNYNNNNNSEKVENLRNHFNYKLDKERPIISSTAMFTTIPSKRKKSSEKDSKKTKPKENKRKSSKESDQQDATDDLLNEESLRKSKELYEKEISLQKEINDLQNDDLEIDGDSDSTEIDSEIAELYQNKEYTAAERRTLLEAKYGHLVSKMTWAEQLETLDKLEELIERDPTGRSLKFAKNFTSLKQLEDFMMRWPGRALELHQKLSSPSRKRISPDSTILQHKARQAKAKQNRELLLQDKSAKIKELFNKVAEVKTMQAMLVEERRKMLDQKLKRAEENRNLHLKNIQEKAHDEAKKQKEIAFINELEAQNKRHDFYALCQEQEDRLQSILGERQRRQEEKAAKEAAVEERRKAIEAERQEKIEELQEKMRKREERIDRELQEKEKERIKVAREKARDREDRMLALQAAQIANVEELQKKIQQKQENSARRHEESIELIRQRAIEIGTPRLTPYQINKLCSVCNVVIDSEVFLLSHLRGPSHQEAFKKYREQFEASVKFSECSIITDAPADILQEKKSKEKERQKTLRKRCKKIRQRLSARSEHYLKDMSAGKETSKKADSSNKKRILKSINEIEKLINTQGGGIWPNNSVSSLERNLFEIIRVLVKVDKNDQRAFADFEGFDMLSKIYNFALDLPKSMPPYPLKCFVLASNLYVSACNDHVDNCLYVLLSNKIVQILEFLLNRLNLIMPNSDDRNGMVVYKADTIADELMHLCSIILSNVTRLAENPSSEAGHASADISQHLQDVVSYIVCTGIVDKLAVYCSSVHDDKSANSVFLLHAIQLLTRLVETRPRRITDKEDSTSLMATLKATELVGAVSMLYAMLLHQDSMSTDIQSSVTVLQSDVVNVIIAALQLFSRVCELNLEFFQNILGAEGISLQVRHIISYLLKYCVQNEGYMDLLHQVIVFIGFFAIHHHENQMILQSGSTPTVLQQLSNLPFAYFSDPKLVRILFPTLLACCVDNPQNKMILDQEMSFQLLEDFKNRDDSKDIPLIKLLH